MKIKYLMLLVIALAACNKPTDYRKYLGDSEIIYPGSPQNLVTQPQYNQITLRFNPSPDPNIVQYIVYWKNGEDSMLFSALVHDPTQFEKLTIPNIPDYELNSFVVRSIDKNKRYSKPVVLNNVRSIGDLYLSGLKNRLLTSVAAATKVVNKIPMDSIFLSLKGIVDTVNVKTEIYWTDKFGNNKTSAIDDKNSKILLPDFKINTWVYYLSFYKPNRYTDESYTPIKGRDSVRIAQDAGGNLSMQ